MSGAVSDRVVEAGRIVQILNEEPYCRIGEVELHGALRKVNLSFVPDARPGERVAVRNGVAFDILGEDRTARGPRSAQVA